MKKILVVLFIFISYSKLLSAYELCAPPPVVSSSVKPNVLIILDNSNSMDEDFYGNAVGSYTSTSKMVQAKKAIKKIIRTNQKKLRIGLETFKISNVHNYYLHNSPYFVSYNPKSYCPNPPEACQTYCSTNSTEAKITCQSQCQNQNSQFNVEYRDEITTNYSIGSEQRTRYCNLVYPKTNFITNPSDPSHSIFYKTSLPMYSSSNLGNAYCYSTSYNPNEGSPYDYYRCYHTKTGESDDFSNYSSYWFSSTFVPTDTDFALGFYDFGRRLSWTYVGKTWFSNNSPGNGYIHVPIDNLTNLDGSNSTTFNNLLSKLDEKENDENGYMSCGNSDKNTCPYIISAGLTPTPGALQTAIDYFRGSNSPIKYRCQKNFIVLVTDGLPSVDENGSPKTADELNATTLNKIDSLHHLIKNISGTNYEFDIKTYVIGVGLIDKAKQQLNYMAIHGHTDVNGTAYFADNPEELEEKLSKIFSIISKSTGAASSVATVTQQVLGEDLVIRGAFTSYDDDPDILTWRGHLEVYKPYFDCSTFTNKDSCLARGCDWSENLCTGKPNSRYDFELCSQDSCPEQYCINTGTRCISKFCSDMEGIKNCIDAGEKLTERTTPRRIFTYLNNQQVNFDLSTDTNATFWNNYLNVQEDFDGDGNQGDSDDIQYLIEFVRGEINGNGTTLRNRKFNWNLGDIVYSSPIVVGAPSENSVPGQIARRGCEQLQKCFQFTDPESCNLHESNYGCFWSYFDNLCTSPDCEELDENICDNQPACQWDNDSQKCRDKTRDQIIGMLEDDTDSCFYSFRIHHQNREKVIYVGANDGMLHAFSVDTGEELWAYIPSNLLSELKYLAEPTYGKPGGCRHRFMVDLSPRAWNVKFKSDNKWHTVLVGGEKEGGDVYFAIDITDPKNPKVLWEYSLFRNLILHDNSGYEAPFTKQRYLELYGNNNSLKTIGASWTEPSMAYLKLGSDVTFKAHGLILPLSDDTNPTSFNEYGSNNLSNWFVIVGGSIKIFNNDELPSFLSDDEKQLIFRPYLLALDIEKGVNIFQNFWPDIINKLFNNGFFKKITNGDNSIPYAFTTPLSLDIWDIYGCNYINDANASSERKEDICIKAKYCTWSEGRCSGMLLGPDGYTDHIVLGDINGNFYNMKFNFSDDVSKILKIEKLKTKKICYDSSNSTCQNLILANPFRSDRQPITISPVAAFDDNYTLRFFVGTGKLDTSQGENDDSNDPAIMSFYNLKDNSGSLVPSGTNLSSDFASGFDVYFEHKCEEAEFGTRCSWVKNENPDSCCISNCDNSCWSCIFDFNQPGERMVFSPLVAGKLVFLTTFVPNDDPCSSGGKGYLYILKYDCKNLFENCSMFSEIDSCLTHKSCHWDPQSDSCEGCEQFDSNSTCISHSGCKWVSNKEKQFCTSTEDILSDSGLKPAFSKSVSELGMAEYTKIGERGYVVNLGPGVPSQPIYSQNKGNKATLFIQTSDAKIFKIDIKVKDKAFLGWSWDISQSGNDE